MKEFLENYNGTDYYLYTIKKGDFTMKVSDYGATLCNYIYKDIDLVQGFDNVHGYIEDVKYMNATIGRVCNRIGDGKFVLNDQEYHLAVNNGPNTLHGGLEGFDTKKWEISEGEDYLSCKYISKDMEEGFPGNLNIEVIYKLDDDGLNYTYRATSDKDTLVNICNHAFFNINGLDSSTILDDYLMINADYIGTVDENGLTLEELLKVDNTPFDFRKRKKIGQDIDSDHIQIKNGSGYDHHFVIKGEGYRHFLTYDNNKLVMDVYSDLPGMHLYSSNFLDDKAHGKNNNTYPRRSSICFETQYYPNAINLNNQIKPILKAGELIEHTTKFKVKEK